MTEAEFWELLERIDWSSHDDDPKAALAPLIASLTVRPVDEIHAFQDQLAAKLHSIDGARWWGDWDRFSGDTFLYARCAVVGRGRGYYERVLEDPSQMPGPNQDFEALLSAAPTAEHRKTGRESGHESPVSFASWSNTAQWPGHVPDNEPHGTAGPYLHPMATRLKARFGYSNEEAVDVERRVDSSDPAIKDLFMTWWDSGEVDSEFQVRGLTAAELVARYRLDPPKAFLLLDWLLRDADAALRSLE